METKNTRARFTLILLLTSFLLRTQDLSIVQLGSNPVKILAHIPVVFEVKIINAGRELARDIGVKFCIQNTENNRMIFERYYSIGMIGGLSTYNITTSADLFYLNRSEPHLVTVEVIFHFDPDPTNNIATMEFTPQPLNILNKAEQWGRNTPFKDNGLDYGALGIQISNALLQSLPKPMLQILCGENEKLVPFAQNITCQHPDFLWVPGSYRPGLINPGGKIEILQVSILALDYSHGKSKIPWYDYIDIKPDELNLVSGGGEPGKAALQPPDMKQTLIFQSPKSANVIYHPNYPNPDLNSNIVQKSATYAGDINASGIAALSGSYLWLSAQNKAMLDINWLELELKEVFSRDALRQFQGGINTLRYVESNLNFIDNLNLPLSMRFQEANSFYQQIPSPHRYQMHSALNSGTNQQAPPDWSFVMNAIQQKHSLVLMIGYYDKNNFRHGGDWIIVTGVVDHENYKGIFYNHDILQNSEQGNRTFYSHIVPNEQSGWMRLQGLDTENYCAWVESAVETQFNQSVTYANLPIEAYLYDLTHPQWKGYNSSGAFEIFVPSKGFNEQGYLNIFVLTPSGQWHWSNRNIPLPVFPDDYSLVNPFSILRWNSPREPLITKYICIFLEFARDIGTCFFDANTRWNILNAVKKRITGKEFSVQLNPPDQDKDHSDKNYNYDLPIPLNKTKADSVKRGCTVPNLDLDTTRHKPNPNTRVQGDLNACGPTAAANSLHWLESVFPDKLKTNLSLREKMEELSRCMGRRDASGVYIDTFIMGKLKFIDKYKLPIKVKFQRCCHWPIADIASPDSTYRHFARCDNDTTKPFRMRWDWLVREMQAGEDVELFISYKDLKKDSVLGGHYVTVTGVKNDGDNRGLWYKDDSDQGLPGGTREVFVHWVVDSMGYPYLAEESDSCRRTYISGMVSESYDSTVKFDMVQTESPVNLSYRNIFIYPNPIAGQYKPIIELHGFSGEQIYYSLYSFDGRKIFTGELVSHSNRMNLELPIGIMDSPGVYFIEAFSPSGHFISKCLKL